MAETLNQLVKKEVNQYRLEVQNQELQTQIAQANRMIEVQNQHVEQLFNSINILICIMAFFVAVFGVIFPLWNAWKSNQMKKEVEEAVKDTNSFITNKYIEWERSEANSAVERYKNGEISWQSLHSILKYKPLNFKHMSEIYNTAVTTDNQLMLECITCYVFKEHFDNKTEEYDKIRTMVINSKYFPMYAYKPDEGTLNALLYIPDNKRENVINQAIDFNIVKFLGFLTKEKKSLLTEANKKYIVDKIVREKVSAALYHVENDKELVDMLIEKGLFESLELNDHAGVSFRYDTTIISLKRNSYLKKKLEDYTVKKISDLM